MQLPEASAGGLWLRGTRRPGFQKAILNDELPFTIGGGIGQSRILYVLSAGRLISERFTVRYGPEEDGETGGRA